MTGRKPKKPAGKASELSRRERQAMDVVFARGRVSVADVQAALPGHPTYSATRVLMRRLYDKKLVTYVMDGPRYIYSAVTPREKAGKDALARLVRTFFDGSTANTFNALLGITSETLTKEELDELEELVAKAKAREQRK
jgi:predicted transcriptional regulator